MTLERHHRFALAAALGLSGIALFDAATHGMTGHPSAFSDVGTNHWLQLAGSAVHGLAYAGGAWVLHVERRRLHANRGAAVFEWLLFAAFAALAAGFLLVMPFTSYGVLGGFTSLFVPVIGIAFLLQFLAAMGLGLSLIKRPETGVGSRILLALFPTFGLTALIAAVAPDWGHPAYVESVTILGAALLGTATPPLRRASDLPPSRIHFRG